MWHSLSHFAHTYVLPLSAVLLVVPVALFGRMVEKKRALLAVVLFVLASLIWSATDETSPLSLLGYLFIALIYIGYAVWQYRRKAVNKPSA